MFTLGASDVRDVTPLYLTPVETALLFIYGWFAIQSGMQWAQVWYGFTWWIYLIGSLFEIFAGLLYGYDLVTIFLYTWRLPPY